MHTLQKACLEGHAWNRWVDILPCHDYLAESEKNKRKETFFCAQTKLKAFQFFLHYRCQCLSVTRHLNPEWTESRHLLSLITLSSSWCRALLQALGRHLLRSEGFSDLLKVTQLVDSRARTAIQGSKVLNGEMPFFRIAPRGPHSWTWALMRACVQPSTLHPGASSQDTQHGVPRCALLGSLSLHSEYTECLFL